MTHDSTPRSAGSGLPVPYYQDDLVTLYHGDCREVLAWLEADVLVTDPPYGTAPDAGKKRGADGYGRRLKDGQPKFTIASDSTTEARDQALDLWGMRGPALVFGSPRLPDPPGEWADRLVWDKKRPGINGGPWRYRHETVYVSAGFVRTDNAAVSIIAAFPEDQVDHVHSKPQALMLRLVAAAPPGVIADPFAGSGSTLAAAKQLGRTSIGVELEERYCEIAAKRLGQETLFGSAS
jgi:DNA modification methylase